MNPLSLLANKFIQTLILKSVRAGVMALGGYVVQHGLATGDQATSLEGSLIFLAGFAFSLFDAFVAKRKMVVAAATGEIPAKVNMLKPPPAATMQPIPNPPAQ